MRGKKRRANNSEGGKKRGGKKSLLAVVPREAYQIRNKRVAGFLFELRVDILALRVSSAAARYQYFVQWMNHCTICPLVLVIGLPFELIRDRRTQAAVNGCGVTRWGKMRRSGGFQLR